jgi:hypothetical protein
MINNIVPIQKSIKRMVTDTLLFPSLTEIVNQIIALYTMLLEAYNAAGAPCGDTPEGLKQWIEEQNESINDGSGM